MAEFEKSEKPDTPPETDALLPDKKFITLVNGKSFELPLLVWGTELRLLKVFKEILHDVIATGIFSGQAMDAADQQAASTKLMTLLLGTAPEKLTEAAAALTRQKHEWVLENLTIETVLELVSSFLSTKSASVGKVLAPYLPANLQPPPDNRVLN